MKDKEYIGKKITHAEFLIEEPPYYDDAPKKECLRLTLEGGEQIEIWDNGQDCCETRYMTCDDDISTVVGGRVLHIEEKDGPEEEDKYGDVHEICFVEIQTDKGFVTLTNHNEHNGYYGGFGLTITKVKQ